MTFIQKHINITNVPMFRPVLTGAKSAVAETGRGKEVQGYDWNANLDSSSDISSFDSYNLHLHYERS